MNTILVKAKKIIARAALATVALCGFLAFSEREPLRRIRDFMFMVVTDDRIQCMRGRGITTNPRRFMSDRCTARTDITGHTATTARIASGMNGITAGGIDRR